MSFSITRDSSFKFIKKIINNSNTPKVGNVALIGLDTLELNSAVINGSSFSIDKTSLDYLNIQTKGVAESNKAVILDSNRNITNINTISVNNLFINGTNVSGTTNSGVSSSPYLNNIQPGYGTENKILSTDSNISVKNINNLSLNNLIENDGSIVSTNLDTAYTEFEEGFSYTSKTTIDTATVPNYYTKINENYLGIYDSVTETLGIGTSFDNISLVNIASVTGRMYGITSRNIAYSPTLNLYCVAYTTYTSYYDSSTGRTTYSVGLTSKKSSSLTTLPSTPTGIGGEGNLYGFVSNQILWVPFLSRFVTFIAYIDTGNYWFVKVYTSTNAINWTMIDLTGTSYGGRATARPATTAVSYNMFYNNTGVYFINTSSHAEHYVMTTSSNFNYVAVSTYVPGVVAGPTYSFPNQSIWFTGKVYSKDLSNWYLLPVEFNKFNTNTFSITHVEYSGSGTLFYLNSYMGCCTFDSSTLEVKLISNNISYINGEYFIVSKRSTNPYLFKYSYVPNSIVPAKTWNPSNYEFLDFNNMSYNIKDYTYSKNLDCYFAIGNPLTGISAQTNNYLFYSKDLNNFTIILTIPNLTYNGIYYSDSTNVLFYYSSTSTTFYYSADNGETWTSKVSTYPIIEIYYEKLFGVYLFNTTFSFMSLNNLTDSFFAIHSSGSGYYYNYDKKFKVLSLHIQSNTDIINTTHIGYYLYGANPMGSGYGNAVTYGIYGRTGFCGNRQLSIVFGSNSPTAYLLSKNSTITVTVPLPSASTSSIWHAPIWIESAKCFVTCSIGTTISTNYNNFMYSGDGHNWNVIKGRYSLAAGKPYGLKYDENSGYLFIFTSTVTMKSRLSFIKNNVTVENVLTNTFTDQLGYNTGYDLSNFNNIYGLSSNSSTNWNGIAYGYGYYIICSTNKICYFDNIYNQNNVTITGEWKSVGYGNRTYVLCGTGKIAYSTDLATWSSVSVVGSWTSVLYKNNNWIISSSDNKIAYSTNLTTWTIVNLANPSVDISYGNSYYLSCGLNNINYSSDLTTWTSVNLTGNWKNIIFGFDKYVVVGDTKIAYSSDLTNWTTITTTQSLNGIIYIKDINTYLVFGTNTVGASTNLSKWYYKTISGNINSTIFAYRLGCTISVGNNNLLLSSNIIKVAVDSANTNINTSLVKSLSLSGTNSHLSIGTNEGSDGHLSIAGSSGVNSGILYMNNRTDESVCTIGTDDANTLKIEINGFVNIQSASFYLGQNILYTSVENLNYLSNLSSGNITNGNSAILLDSNGNTSGINQVNVDKLIINGELYVPDLTDKLTSTPGSSSSNKALITDSNNSIEGVSKISTNSITVKNDNFTNNVNPSISSTNYKTIAIYCTMSGTSDNIYDMTYLESKGIYVVIPNISTFNANTFGEKTYLLYSYDGINWYKKPTNLSVYAKQIFETKYLTDTTQIYLLCTNDVTTSNKVYKTLDFTNWDARNKTGTLDNFSNCYNSPTSMITINEYGVCYVDRNQFSTNRIATGNMASTDIFSLSFYSYSPVYNLSGIFKGFLINSSSNLCIMAPNNVYVASPTAYVSSGTTSYTIFDGIVINNTTNNTFIVVTVGSGGNMSYSTPLSNTSYSNFTLTTSVINSGGTLSSICYNKTTNKLLAVGNAGTNRIMVCNDISNLSVWTAITTNVPSCLWNLCKSAGSKGFIISNIDSGDYKNNKIGLIDINNNFIQSQVGYDYVYGKGTYAFGYFLLPIYQTTTAAIPKMVYSSDGINWNINNDFKFTNYVYSIDYSPSLNIAIVGVGNTIKTSSDGLTWNTVYTASGGIFAACKWIPELSIFMCLAKGLATENLVKSTDGINWTTVTTPNSSMGDFAYAESINTIMFTIMEGDSAGNSIGTYYSTDGGNTFLLSNIPPNYTYIAGRFLYWNKFGNYFKMTSTSNSNLITYDCINWNNNFSYTSVSDSYLSTNLTSQFVFVNSLNLYVGVACSFSLGYNINPVLVCTSDGFNLSVLAYLNTGASVVDYDRIIYAESVNKLLVYKRDNASKVGDKFIVVDLDEYKYKINGEIDIEELDNKYNYTSTSNALNNWDPITITRPFTGKIKWISSKGMFASVAGASTITSGQQLFYSANGYRWAAATDTTLATATCYDLEDIPNSGDLALILNSTGKIVIYGDLKVFGSAVTTISFNATISTPKKIFYLKKYKTYIYTSSVSDSKIYIFEYGNSTNYTVSEFITLPTSIIVGSISYSSELNMFVILPSNATSTFFYGNSLLNLSSGTLDNSLGGYEACAYSSLLKMFVAAPTNGSIIYSTDGINWITSNSTSSTYSEIIWVNDLNLFVATSTTASTSPIIYSSNGIDWTNVVLNTSESIYSIAWSPINGNFVACAGSNKIFVSVPIFPKPGNVLNKYTSNTAIGNGYTEITNNNSSSGGLIVNALYTAGDGSANNDNMQLILGDDSAYKPTSSAWTISSDERIKENIELANLDICYDNIKNLELKKYKWKDEYIEEYKLEDQNKLGWIAQDVEQFYPKSVSTRKVLGIEDCKSLDTDQIITGLYGSIQKLCNKYKDLENKLN